jgi:cation:H+ antiporter
MLATDYLLFNIPLFIIGLVLLLKGSDWFVDSSSFFAHRLKISEIIIGLTLVSIGTSLPELATNIYASFTKQGEIALGNVVGSNITNIALVMGLGCVLIKGPLTVPKLLLKRDGIIMLASFLFFFLLALTGTGENLNTFDRIDGLLLLLFFIGYCAFLFKNKNALEDAATDEEESEADKKQSISHAIWYFILGLFMIFFGAKVAVDTAVRTAKNLQIPKELIAATIIAFGTSVPELSVTITSIAKKKNDLALGNIIGSCIFNLVLVMGVAITIAPVPVSSEMLKVLLPIMLLTGIILLFFMKTGHRLVKAEGAILLLIYILFITYNVRQVL